MPDVASDTSRSSTPIGSELVPDQPKTTGNPVQLSRTAIVIATQTTPSLEKVLPIGPIVIDDYIKCEADESVILVGYSPAHPGTRRNNDPQNKRRRRRNQAPKAVKIPTTVGTNSPSAEPISKRKRSTEPPSLTGNAIPAPRESNVVAVQTSGVQSGDPTPIPGEGLPTRRENLLNLETPSVEVTVFRRPTPPIPKTMRVRLFFPEDAVEAPVLPVMGPPLAESAKRIAPSVPLHPRDAVPDEMIPARVTQGPPSNLQQSEPAAQTGVGGAIPAGTESSTEDTERPLDFTLPRNTTQARSPVVVDLSRRSPPDFIPTSMSTPFPSSGQLGVEMGRSNFARARSMEAIEEVSELPSPVPRDAIQRCEPAPTVPVVPRVCASVPEPQNSKEVSAGAGPMTDQVSIPGPVESDCDGSPSRGLDQPGAAEPVEQASVPPIVGISSSVDLEAARVVGTGSPAAEETLSSSTAGGGPLGSNLVMPGPSPGARADGISTVDRDDCSAQGKDGEGRGGEITSLAPTLAPTRRVRRARSLPYSRPTKSMGHSDILVIRGLCLPAENSEQEGTPIVPAACGRSSDGTQITRLSESTTGSNNNRGTQGETGVPPKAIEPSPDRVTIRKKKPGPPIVDSISAAPADDSCGVAQETPQEGTFCRSEKRLPRKTLVGIPRRTGGRISNYPVRRISTRPETSVLSEVGRRSSSQLEGRRSSQPSNRISGQQSKRISSQQNGTCSNHAAVRIANRTAELSLREESNPSQTEETFRLQLEESILYQPEETVRPQSEETVRPQSEESVQGQPEESIPSQPDKSISKIPEESLQLQLEESLLSHPEKTLRLQVDDTIPRPSQERTQHRQGVGTPSQPKETLPNRTAESSPANTRNDNPHRLTDNSQDRRRDPLPIPESSLSGAIERIDKPSNSTEKSTSSTSNAPSTSSGGAREEVQVKTEKPEVIVIPDSGDEAEEEEETKPSSILLPYCCGFCNKQFDDIRHLEAHMTTHKRNYLFHCSQCSKGFCKEETLKDHMKSHAPKKYECRVCKASFARKQALTSHEKTHDKLHQCNECGATFARADGLRRHKRLHTGERPYCCGICDSDFTSAAMLKRHMTMKHKAT